ncbi:MAG: OsmC family peroxiredoxin [Candidatus Omnitrophica bacterium]|nr:OsmC family peroxiredoxin [Candidatus Omnitrophota bacterium]
MPKEYVFRTGLRWSGAKKGTLSSQGKLNIGVATPPEFNGEEGYWSPEELLISAVDSCIMTTFLHYAEKKKVGLDSYQSEAEGVLKMVEGRLMFSRIKVRSRITVGSEEDIDKVKDLMRSAEKNCLISNSMRSQVEILPQVMIGVSNGRSGQEAG